MRKSREKRGIDERFWEKVDKTEQCWIWKGYRTWSGYGRFSLLGRPVSATRISWAMAHGTIPIGMFVCHSCDNPPCVRPDHLFLGNQKDNMQDALKKNRVSLPPHSYGLSHHNGKLSNEQVMAIRNEYIPKVVTCKMLGLKYGVAIPTVYQVIRNRTHGTVK